MASCLEEHLPSVQICCGGARRARRARHTPAHTHIITIRVRIGIAILCVVGNRNWLAWKLVI